MIKTLIETFLISFEALGDSYAFIYEERKNRRLSVFEWSHHLANARSLKDSLNKLIVDSGDIDHCSGDVDHPL